MPDDIKADLIRQDKTHRFVSDYQINNFTNKIDKEYLDDKLDTINTTIRRDMNENFDNIFNTKDIYKYINSLSVLFKDNEDILNIIRYSSKLDSNVFQNHLNSNMHLNDVDRARLDNLRFVCKTSYADWNASESDCNYIANKPESLPAKGGDSDTVGGRDISQIMCNKRSNTVVIGSKDNCTEDDVHYLCDGTNDSEMFKEAIKLAQKNNGSIYIREGNYFIKESLIIKDISINGAPKGTNINIIELEVNNCSLDGLIIIGCKEAFSIVGNVNMTNCKIIECLFKLTGFYNTVINCRIEESELSASKLTYNIIKDNIIIGTKQLYYTGGNNIIKDNIYNNINIKVW